MPASMNTMRAGSIKRVKVVNFMCHSELTIDFGCQVSFVTGQNGSGKSAILAAIVSGFGARANATNRAGKISDLIKHGQNSASVTIYLHNQGTDPQPFHPEIYGSSIQIERTIHRDKSSYKISSSKGKVISKKRHDLDAILEHYDIQVNNPVFLMNQDTCRSFLNSKTGKELYSFFYKAPLLDEMEINVENTQRQTEEARSVVNGKEQEVEPIRAAIVSWSEKQEKCVQPQRIKKQIEVTETSIRIKCYQKLIAEVEIAQRAVRTAEARLQEHESGQVRKEQRIPDMKEKLEELKEQQQVLTPLMAQSRDVIEKSRPLLIEVRDAVQAAKAKLDDAKAELEEKRRSLREFEKQLEKAKIQQDSDESDRKREDLERELQEMKEKLQNFSTDRAAAISERGRLHTEAGKAKNDLELFWASVQKVKHHVEQIERELREFQTTSQNSQNVLLRLGGNGLFVRQKEFMDSLVKSPGFLNGGVLGPCALEIGLTDDVYSKVVEKVVGSYFRTYVIEDERDRQKIIAEFNKARIPVPWLDCVGGSLMTSETQFEDVGVNLHHSLTKNPHIRNVLIDALHLHKILVMPTREMARQYYRDGPPFPGCKMVYDLNADQHSKDEDGYMFVPSSDYGYRPVLVKDFAADLERRVQERNLQIVLLEEKKDKHQELEAKWKEIERQLMTKSREVKQLDDNENRAQFRLASITTELDTLRTVQPIDIQVLLEEVDELKTAVEVAESAVAELTTALEKLKAKEAKGNARFLQMRETAQQEVKQLDEVQAQIERLERRLEEMEGDVRNVKKNFTLLNNILKEKKQIWEEMNERAEIQKAELLASGVEERKFRIQLQSEEELETLVFKLRNTLRNLNVDVDNSWEFCQQKLDELRENEKTIDVQLRIARDAVNLMHKNALQRKENFATARQKASAVLCELFTHIMMERGYEGFIDLDHEDRILKFRVKPRPDAANGDSSVKSLSGGERSFTMVSFLLSLWQLIQIPFRVLDEFDVFMDMLNRDHAMLRLIQAAVESGRQFIFLTPLAFSQSVLDTFKEQDEVEVVRMPTASRNVNGTQALTLDVDSD